MFPIQCTVLWCFPFAFVREWIYVEAKKWLLYFTSLLLTSATVAILVELIALCAIALVHSVVKLIAELLARTPLTATSWNDKAEDEH